MKVAFGKVKITPEKYIGIPLAGYTPIPKCTGKRDDIFANAVIIEDVDLGNIKRHLLFISLDVLKMALVLGDYIKEQIQKAHGIPPGQIILHATHTHKSVDLTGEFGKAGGYPTIIKKIMCAGNDHDKYVVWIARQIVKLVGQLLHNLLPCKIAWEREPIRRDDIVINRRHPSRHSKPDVGVIAFRGIEDDKLIGFIMQFACHGTTLGMFTTELSADWMGQAIQYVQEATNGTVQAIYISGPSGDLNPITSCGTNFEWLETHRKFVYGQTGTYKSTKRIGKAVGKQALQLAQNIAHEDFLPSIEFRSYGKTFWVPMKDFSYFSKTWFQNKIIYLVKKNILMKLAVTHEEPNFPGLAIKHRGRLINDYSSFQWIQIVAKSMDGKTAKELGILTIPGELFEDIGDILRKIAPTNYLDTFIFQNTTDWVGYLFSRKEYVEQAGYEPLPSFSPVGGETIVVEVKKLFDEVAAGVNLSYS